ncbi:MAG: phenylalanine--tRNA ligase subunit beta [Planctomycetia bacterium]|nr:phenylalanine--tRNA ligase subunit beta [Planctomycetia bacterium]
MIISYEWLRQYVPLVGLSVDEFALRMMMAGFNHESTTAAAGDYAVDLEITSNRPDCLGHIGLAREAAVIFGSPLALPKAAPQESGPAVDTLAQLQVDAPLRCPRYIARVIRGVKVGPSPAWLQKRLAAIGQPTVNNAVDITNYVLMECGQPLHAFDLAKLRGKKIIVREAVSGEKFAAINHKQYVLEPGMTVIADAERPVAIAGIMGGVDSEVSSTTTDLLIESADFDPLSIRTAARKLALRSDSSYRFERGVDPEGIEWASRRCCELILEICGGELAVGSLDVGEKPKPREPITLRLAQLKRIVGINIPGSEVLRILTSLGLQPRLGSAGIDVRLARDAAGGVVVEHTAKLTPSEMRQMDEAFARKDLAAIRTMTEAKNEVFAELPSDASGGMQSITVVPPSWRRDLSREIDLIEEAARIYGYDKIPEDVGVPMAPSARTDEDRVLNKIRHVLTACGFDEALTISVVDDSLSTSFSPWTDAAPLALQMPILERADKLRRSLVPSLLKARRDNEAVGNRTIELFETAKVYLPRAGALPQEELMLALTSSGEKANAFFALKGTIEAVVSALAPAAQVDVRPTSQSLFATDRACELLLDGEPFGVLGEVGATGQKKFDLRGKTVVAELKIAALIKAAVLVPRYVPTPDYPAIERDINLVVDEQVRWNDIAATVRSCGGDLLATLDLKGEPFRDEKKLGAGKKSLVITLLLRSRERTLTNTEADELRTRIVDACAKAFGASLRS